MEKTAYLDHNVIVDLANEDIAKSAAAFPQARVKPVLSPSHWVEAARSPTPSEALRTASVMDSLNALWLRERRSIQRREIRAWASGSPCDLSIIDPISTTITEVATELSGVQGAAVVTTSATVVSYLQANPNFRTTMEAAYRSNAEGFERNVQHVRQGELTPEKEQEIWGAWLSTVAREAQCTPSPNQLASSDRKFFPSIFTEFEIAKENWKRAVENPKMKLSPQRLGDAFHVMVALPYVAYVVSGDHRLRGLISCVRHKLPFPTGEPVESLPALMQTL